MGFKCRNGELKPEVVGWKEYMVATIRKTSSLSTGERAGLVGRWQSTIRSHSIAANLITEDQIKIPRS